VVTHHRLGVRVCGLGGVGLGCWWGFCVLFLGFCVNVPRKDLEKVKTTKWKKKRKERPAHASAERKWKTLGFNGLG